MIRLIEDKLWRMARLTEVPMRIVCLVASITEFLVYIGLTNHLVGVTKFCIHPKIIRQSRLQIGGVKKSHLD